MLLIDYFKAFCFFVFFKNIKSQQKITFKVLNDRLIHYNQLTKIHVALTNILS